MPRVPDPETGRRQRPSGQVAANGVRPNRNGAKHTLTGALTKERLGAPNASLACDGFADSRVQVYCTHGQWKPCGMQRRRDGQALSQAPRIGGQEPVVSKGKGVGTRAP